MSRASLDKHPAEVAAMFDGVAAGYDRTNWVMSLGRDRRWREHTRQALQLKPGEAVLDVACGTGVSTVELARAGVRAVGCDFSLGMLRAGRHAGRGNVTLVAGDALALPFADGAFDAVTISFGLRNVVDVPRALVEMARVTRSGGRLAVCETSHPAPGAYRRLYDNYLIPLLPVVARGVSSNPVAYRYLAETMRAWPDQPELARLLGSCGWAQVQWRSLSGGQVALHRARRP